MTGGPYYIEINPPIFRENYWTGFCMMGTSNMKELKEKIPLLTDNPSCCGSLQSIPPSIT